MAFSNPGILSICSHGLMLKREEGFHIGVCICEFTEECRGRHAGMTRAIKAKLKPQGGLFV